MKSVAFGKISGTGPVKHGVQDIAVCIIVAESSDHRLPPDRVVSTIDYG